ncbi:MAG: ATP synthase F0 subunit B [Oscillospiraceae bacterium]|jgi:membrane protein involved in colicin uptake|nr:ATP synthase F0 subunit B [Oscillospiraceae bacterium]
MASDVNELLDMLFEMIEEAKGVPLASDKCMVDRTDALDRIDEIRSAFPMELAEAKKLLAARNDYLASAKREGDLIIQQAEERAKQLLAENELLNKAKRESEEMRRKAEELSRELKQAANRYCDDALRRTEEAVAEAYDEIKRSRAQFRAKAAGMTEPPQPQNKPFDAETEG